MLEALDGSEELIQLLLDKGADVNAKAPYGATASRSRRRRAKTLTRRNAKA